MAKTNSPTYIRLAREKTPIITTEDTPFEIGKAQIFYRPTAPVKVGIIACGSLVYNSIMAARELEGEGIGAVVMNIGTVKPIDREAVIALAKECGAIVTVEEHQIAGGMGSAVSEVLSAEHPTKMAFVGVQDKFGQSGTPLELIEHYGMGINHIKEVVKKLL
jgi:transketolase